MHLNFGSDLFLQLYLVHNGPHLTVKLDLK